MNHTHAVVLMLFIMMVTMSGKAHDHAHEHEHAQTTVDVELVRLNEEEKELNRETIKNVPTSIKLEKFAKEHDLGTITIPDAKEQPGVLFFGLVNHEGTLGDAYKKHVTQFVPVPGETRTMTLHGYADFLLMVEVHDSRSHHGLQGGVTWHKFNFETTMGEVAHRLGEAKLIADHKGNEVYPMRGYEKISDVWITSDGHHTSPILRLKVKE